MTENSMAPAARRRSTSLQLTLTVIFASLAGIMAQAAPYNAGGIAVDADTSWVTGPVLTEAMALTKQLDRPVLTYHWVPRKYVQATGQQFPTSGPVANDDASAHNLVIENMTSRMARFWDLGLPISGRAEGGGAMAPNGLYVAMEPLISQSYGGSNWLMYQIEHPRGTRYLDGRFDHPAMGANLIRALNARGCAARDGFTTRELIKSDTPNQGCRKALNDIVAATNSGLVAYIFRAEPMRNDCYEWSTAFVLIRPDAVSKFNFFVQDRPAQPDGLDSMRSLINSVFERNGKAGPFSSVAAASQADSKNFITSNYFSCNPAIREW